MAHHQRAVLVINSLFLIECVIGVWPRRWRKKLPLLEPILINGVYRNDASAHIRRWAMRCIPAAIFRIFVFCFSVSTPHLVSIGDEVVDMRHVDVWRISWINKYGRQLHALRWKHETCVGFWWYSAWTCLFATPLPPPWWGERGAENRWENNSRVRMNSIRQMESTECCLCHASKRVW